MKTDCRIACDFSDSNGIVSLHEMKMGTSCKFSRWLDLTMKWGLLTRFVIWSKNTNRSSFYNLCFLKGCGRKFNRWKRVYELVIIWSKTGSEKRDFLVIMYQKRYAFDILIVNGINSRSSYILKKYLIKIK